MRRLNVAHEGLLRALLIEDPPGGFRRLLIDVPNNRGALGRRAELHFTYKVRHDPPLFNRAL